ncbi:MAG: nuclear transport factor 2 family protein [Pseudomonadales bacterium]
MNTVSDLELREAIDKQAIREVCMLYCRAVDRLDEAVLPRVFHDDATVAYGTYDGPTSGFIANTFAHLKTMERTFHCLGNQLIVLDGDHATGEVYVYAYICTKEDSGELVDTLLVGRYLDRYERRAGIWKIAHRAFVMDWNQNQPNASEWEKGMYAELRTRGCRGSDDPLYSFLR